MDFGLGPKFRARIGLAGGLEFELGSGWTSDRPEPGSESEMDSISESKFSPILFGSSLKPDPQSDRPEPISSLSLSKRVGGLGVKAQNLFNQVLLTKWGWRLLKSDHFSWL